MQIMTVLKRSGKRRLPVAGVLLSVAAGMILSACVSSKLNGGDEQSLTSSWVRPDDPQESLGAKEHPLVLAQYGGVYSDVEAERVIAVIVGKLVAVSNDPARVYKIHILNSPKVNAFALPGGFLYVTRGLLALANDSSELAAVIAHEMAHVSANHAIIRKERQSSAKLGEKVVSDVLGGNAAGRIALAANQIRLTSFSQDQELQADTVGIRMIGRAGYDPFAAARFLRTMELYRYYQSQGNNGTQSFISSHPSTPKRIEFANRHARFFGAPGVGDRARERYLQGINGLQYGDTVSEGFIRDRTFSHIGMGITFTAPAGFRIDNQPKAVMVSGPGEVATRFDAAVLSSQRSLSQYLRSGWISGLQEDTIRQETINGFESATAVARGDGWRFRVRVLRSGSQVYRFITAAPQTSTTLDSVSDSIAHSFRKLNKAQKAAIKPLAIKVVTAKRGQGVSYFTRRMKGQSNPEKLLRILNGLGSNDAIEPGQQIKLVVDQ